MSLVHGGKPVARSSVLLLRAPLAYVVVLSFLPGLIARLSGMGAGKSPRNMTEWVPYHARPWDPSSQNGSAHQPRYMLRASQLPADLVAPAAAQFCEWRSLCQSISSAQAMLHALEAVPTGGTCYAVMTAKKPFGADFQYTSLTCFFNAANVNVREQVCT